MKTNLNKIYLLIPILLIAWTEKSFTQELIPDWKFKTSGKVLASPLKVDNNIFIGDEKGIFYSINISTGEANWQYETGGNIQARATKVGENIFFESANTLYLLERKNGKLVWKYELEMEPFVFKYQDKEWPYKIDPYDDKRSIGLLNDGIIFIGCGNGKLLGFNAKNGQVVKEYSSDGNSPIRSSPYIQEGKIFFGDWNGVVYCYSIKDDNLVWKKKTYRVERPYPTFGGVVSEFTSYKGLLYFGARNHMLNVLATDSGDKDWTFTDKQGGWMIGDPVVFSDTLYMGGSDNFSMKAFDPIWGRNIWSYRKEKMNIYTKPVVNDDWVIYTAGDAYNGNEPGMLILLDRKSGKELATYEVPMGSFSSPILVNQSVLFGCYDGHVYSIKIE